MKLEFVQTFLAVVDTGSFVAASDRLNVTQSTVSARIQALEEELGQVLFRRDRSGAALTRAGERFLRPARGLWRQWQEAKLDVAVPAGFRAVLRVGGQFSLWDRTIVRWLPWMRQARPDLIIQAEVGHAEGLVSGLIDGLIDLAVMYTPTARSDLVVEPLFEERLVLVSTRPFPAGLDRPAGGYIFVDWGPEFRRMHDTAFPDQPLPPVRVALGALGLRLLIENGGSGYFPLRVVRPLLADGQLFAAPAAPEFRRPVHMVWPRGSAIADDLSIAVDGLKMVAAADMD